MLNIHEIFGPSMEHLVAAGYGVANTKNTFICGAELEIEGVETFVHLNKDPIIECLGVTNDDSLRNNGKEVLIYPGTSNKILTVFNKVHSLGVFEEDQKFSHRTSIHIHVNCTSSTSEQVKKLLYLYSIFEPLLYSFVGQSRKNNIYCVPLSYTTMSKRYHDDIVELVYRWHKYCGFNLLPLKTYGTVEFRHLYGTDDPVILEAWLNILETLWMEAQQPTDIFNMRMLSTVEQEILKYKSLFEEPPSFILEDNLIDVKLSKIN